MGKANARFPPQLKSWGFQRGVIMIVLFSGSRDIGDMETAKQIINKELNKLNRNTDLIIHGGARGVDTLVNQIATLRHFKVQVYLPDYNLYGSKYAPLKRNEQMINEADKIIILWNGVSNGTRYVYDYAKYKKKLIVDYHVW